MSVSFFVNPNQQIEIKYKGELTFEDNMKMIEGVHALCVEFGEDGKKVLILADLTEAGLKIDPHAVQFSAKFARDTNFDKCAVYGVNDFFGKLLNTITTVSGKSDRIRAFDNREEAVKWLEE